MAQPVLATPEAAEAHRRLSIGFINFAHALDHYVMLIFPTVVIGLEVVYGRPYGELLLIGSASFFAVMAIALSVSFVALAMVRRHVTLQSVNP